MTNEKKAKTDASVDLEPKQWQTLWIIFGRLSLSVVTAILMESNTNRSELAEKKRTQLYLQKWVGTPNSPVNFFQRSSTENQSF